MNLSHDVKTIHSDTFVASMSQVDNIVDSEKQPSNKKSLTPALNELLKKMSAKVTVKQRSQVKELF